MSKSNEYGFIPEAPTQANGSNTGIFEVNDVVDLLIANQWTLQSDLVLIQTQSFTNQINVDFTDIKETVYDTHFYTINYLTVDTSTESVGLRFYENGVLETGTVYSYAFENRDTSGTHNASQGTTGDRIYASTAVAQGSADTITAYGYIYNAGNSSKYTSVNVQSTGIDSILEMRYGGGSLTQASLVDGFRFYNNGGNNMSGKISLYGIAR